MNNSEVPQFNEEGYHVKFIPFNILEARLAAAIQQYALAHQEEWSQNSSFHPDVNPVLIGYTFKVNTQVSPNVFEVYPVYEHDVISVENGKEINTRRKVLKANNLKDGHVVSWAIEEEDDYIDFL